MFGSSPPPQNELTEFHPRSPYGCAKVYGYWQTINYRESYDMFASNGITFNMESPNRGQTFVTRKVTLAASRIKEGLQDTLWMGNLKAKRDWGYVGDYCNAFWMMLQAPAPNDFVVCTGESHSIEELLHKAFGHLNLDWQDHVKIDSKYLRPTEVDHLEGDYSKIKSVLNWKPVVKFDKLIEMMVEYDHKLAKQEKMLSKATNNESLLMPGI